MLSLPSAPSAVRLANFGTSEWLAEGSFSSALLTVSAMPGSQRAPFSPQPARLRAGQLGLQGQMSRQFRTLKQRAAPVDSLFTPLHRSWRKWRRWDSQSVVVSLWLSLHCFAFSGYYLAPALSFWVLFSDCRLLKE